jgi:hypothetical protein
MKGRHKAGCPHYFAAHKKPPDFNVEGCDHPDVDVRNLGTCSPEVYWKDLVYVLLSTTNAQYRQRRLETGISKPSIFLGFPSNRIFGVPTCFGSDIMHLLSLNIPDLLIPLWRGTFECDKDDDKSTWTWAVLVGDAWKEFGRLVEESTSHLPGCFDRPPRNPEKKINSGYKAWEFTLLLYGLCVVFLHGVLPNQYWVHFCKLVRAVRIISQHHITQTELCVAARLMIEFIEEFEDLYYQCRVDRIHFMRQSIHALGHYATEVQSKGPLICASQWTMERTIGNLVVEMRQPSKPYENLSQRAFRRAQHNALMSIFPILDPDYNKPPFPKWSKDIGGGYALLKQQERHRHSTSVAEGRVIQLYLQAYHPQSPEFGYFNDDGSFRIIRWARLRLPNGQTSRSLFATRERRHNARRARNAKVLTSSKFSQPNTNFIAQLIIEGAVYFAEVQFFFQILPSALHEEFEPLALVSLYSDPDRDLLRTSSETFYTCTYQGQAGLAVVKATYIQSVVAMVPHVLNDVHRFYMFEKPGLDVADLGGFLRTEDDGDGEDNDNE